MIAIPDFAAGVMENYGLVTYQETVLLYDDQNSAAANKERVATIFGKLDEANRIFYGYSAWGISSQSDYGLCKNVYVNNALARFHQHLQSFEVMFGEFHGIFVTN
ncbi:hypothetical protein Lal_00037842 [Lupinus albus]|nr:hypothetical protein Lal_00037842 [Lupinus albus]